MYTDNPNMVCDGCRGKGTLEHHPSGGWWHFDFCIPPLNWVPPKGWVGVNGWWTE